MKCLFVTEAYPWPPRDGYRMRLANLVEALAEISDVDLLCTDRREWTEGSEPRGVNVIAVPEGPQAPTREWLLPWLRSAEPRRVLWRDFGPVRAALGGHLDSHYDLAVFGHLETFVGLGDAIDAPAIVDFDNLENLSMRSRRAVGPDTYAHQSVRERLAALLQWAGRTLIDLVDERRWDRSQRAVASQVAAVLVCSEIDVSRSLCDNAVCVPNGYAEPDDLPARRAGALVDPVYMFVGSMAYPPNADAARWFATEVFPRVRSEIPGATLRLVGRNPEHIDDLGSLEGVVLVGQVDEIDPELAMADVSVVPVRSGAGTRLKVLEAMCCRLPIASTTLGSEGISLVDGVSAMVNDDPAQLSAACVRLAREEDLRESLTASAYQLFTERYRWSSIRRAFSALAIDVASAGPAVGRTVGHDGR